MAVPFSNTKLRVPRGFQNLLEGLAKEVLRNQPENIYAFASIYFDNLLKIRQEQGIDPADIGAKHEDHFYNNSAFTKAGNMGDVSDPQQQEAATTIQAAVRGHQAREEVKQDTTDEEKAKEDEAATRIQAVYRGYEARKRVNLLKEEDATEESRTETDKDYSDPEIQSAAATKIQASYRGFQTRKSLKEKDKLSEGAEPPGDGFIDGEGTEREKPSEEIIDIDLTDPEVEKAALKIQGGFKILKAKKQVEQMKIAKDSSSEQLIKEEKEETKAEEEADHLAPPEQEEVDIDLTDPDVEKAAEKIQAGFRGFQTRKKLKEEKESGEAKADTEEVEDDSEEVKGQTEEQTLQKEEVDIDLNDPEMKLKEEERHKEAPTKAMDDTPSAEAQPQPAEEVQSTEEEAPSTQEEAPPTQEEPTDGDAPSSEVSPPIEEGVPPTEEEDPPTEEGVPPTEEALGGEKPAE